MKRKEIMFIAILFLAYNTISAQKVGKDSILSFSLKNAQDYALQNSPLVKNAGLDMDIAKKKIWETTAIGLPQVNSKFSYSYQITLPAMETEFSELTGLFGWMYGVDSYLYNQTSGHDPYFGNIKAPDPNQKVATENQLRWGLTYDITASEIIFNGSFIVGLQTTKVYKQLSEQGYAKSQLDVTEQVTNAYYLVLIAQENTSIIDSSYANTEKIYEYIKAMHAQGLMEETDEDQMQLTLSTLKNARDMLTRQTEVTKNLLKFQMGIDLAKQVILTDNLTTLIETSDLSALLTKDFNVKNNNDYKLMETQEKLSGLNLKLQQSSLLPDVAGFYTHEENFNKNSFSFTPPNMVGLSVNIPIFGSGMKLAKISEAKISLEKAKNSTEQTSLGLQSSFSDAKSSFINAAEKYQTCKQNILLAGKIYNKSLIKYKEGIIGSMELTQSQNQYLQAQSDYYTSIIGFTTTKSKLEKLLK
jgi:outer membrane protein